MVSDANKQIRDFKIFRRDILELGTLLHLYLEAPSGQVVGKSPFVISDRVLMFVGPCIKVHLRKLQ